MKKILLLFGGLYFAILFSACSNTSGTDQSLGEINGTVFNRITNEPLSNSAFFFLNDSFITQSENYGTYTIDNVHEGTYILICSSLGFLDTTIIMEITNGKKATLNIYLQESKTTGRIYGEFQDMTLFNQQLQNDSSLSTYSAKNIFDATTGATLQSKFLFYEVPLRNIHLGDSLIAVSDGFGQYWKTLQIGTYQLTGSCPGYNSSSQIIHIEPGALQYLNFFLERNQP